MKPIFAYGLAQGIITDTRWSLPMTATAQKLLAEFDALPPADRQQVAVEILRRTSEPGDLPEAALDELAAELFRAYDAEEAARAQS